MRCRQTCFVKPCSRVKALRLAKPDVLIENTAP